MKEKNWKKRGHILIEIIIIIQNKIIENKEKLKIMKLKEEIDKKTELLKKKMETQDKNDKIILKSNKNDINIPAYQRLYNDVERRRNKNQKINDIKMNENLIQHSNSCVDYNKIDELYK